MGPHSHTADRDVAHFCDVRCHACGYFCNLPIGHIGDHNTNHGNMKHVYFVAESEEIEIHDRKYAWGESGGAEMCNMHCKSQGRSHIHLIPCLSKEGGACADKVIAGNYPLSIQCIVDLCCCPSLLRAEVLETPSPLSS